MRFPDIISWNPHYISASKEKTLHFIAEETEVQGQEAACMPHSQEVQGQAQLT